MAKYLCLAFCFLCLVQSISYSQPKCCCGTVKELAFPGFDFEFPPDPPTGWFFTYTAGNTVGQSPWNVTVGAVDHIDGAHNFLSFGNPNGPSHYLDLVGSLPKTPGAVSYVLTGLTAGYQYTYEFYYATGTIPGNYKAYLKIANGAWLNVTITASNPGNIIWLKASYNFIAQASSANLEFIDASSGACDCGVLLDDMKMFECPVDLEKPVVGNPPKDIFIECDKDLPKIPTLDIGDNCDPNPLVTFKEFTNIINPCTKKITRNWEIKDACGNIQTVEQIIDISDQNPPEFTKLPENISVECDVDVQKEFNDWIKMNGNAIAIDACDFSWRNSYSRLPYKYCDVIPVRFFAKDNCGNESSEIAYFNVIDKTAPEFIVKAESRNFICIPNIRDSLRTWLKTFGFSKVSDNCGVAIMSSDFKGDSTVNPLNLTFYAEDNCGNKDSCKASFSYRNNGDTFRIKTYSCNFVQNSIDTIQYTTNGCDSIVIDEKIKRFKDSVYIKTYTCDLQQKKFDTVNLVNTGGCDSLVYYEFVLKPKAVTTLQKMDCSYTKASSDTAYLLGQYCDSIVITEYIPLRKDSGFIIHNTCDVNKADTSILSLTNSAGCDSIITVYTIYSQQQMTFIDSKVCGLTKTFADTVKFTTGLCDSLVITTQSSLPLDTTYINSTTCDKSKTGIFSNKLINRYGCDSLVLEDVILNPSDSVFISKSTCILSQSGINIQPLKNKFGCDSIVQTTISFIPSDTIHIIQYTCNLSNERSDTKIYKGNSCDSVVFLTTVFVPSDTTLISQTTCDLAAVGLKTLILKGKNCDSVVFINTLFIPSDTTQITQTTCDPAISGFSSRLLQNSKGCDSLLLIDTKYIPLHLAFNLDSISCFNQNDGIFRIVNNSEFSKPLELVINNKNLGNLSQINNLSPGAYEIFVRDQKGCITDSVKFILSNPEALIIELGNDLEVKQGTKINLNLFSNKTVQNIFWQPAHLTNCNNCNQINFTVDQDIWVFAQAIDERNCNQTDSIFIRVKKSGSVFAPNSFSPNGDNANDYFFIKGDDNAIVETLFIYDRWGEQVFETHDIPVNVPTVGWNGTFNSQKMNPGVFVFYAKVKKDDGEIVELKGDVTLMR